MDLDLLSEYLREDSHASPSGQLLSNLTSRELTSDESIADVPLPAQARDFNLQASSPSWTNANWTNANQTGAVISKIERIFESITDCILSEKKVLVIKLKTRPRTRVAPDVETEALLAPDQKKSNLRAVKFPSRNPQEAWRFTALLRILELSHEALVTGTVTTKRDIYYREPELFMKQVVVDRYVDDIAYTLGVNRDALNIVAAAKGLVAGSFSVTRKDGSTIDYALEAEGHLIPNPSTIQHIHPSDIRWILVIEKEATFRTLATNQYWKDSAAGQGIIITAKGYPDIQTRQFLHLLSFTHPHIPIHALVDYDPDGIGIMSTYKHGSMSLSHETNIAVPSIQWLGVRSCDFMSDDNNHENEKQGLLKLSRRDRRIAGKMLGRGELDGKGDGEAEVEWRRELQVMLFLNVKAEIQILGCGERLGEWLDGKLSRGVGEDVGMTS